MNCRYCYQLLSYLFETNSKLEDEVNKLTEELFETNRGVLALVQEFEKTNEDLLKSDDEKNSFLENLKKTNKEQLEKIKIQERALIQADKMASLGQLVAGVAHEINNPTTYIRSNIELLHKYYNIILNHIPKGIEDQQLKNVLNDMNDVLQSMYKGTERIADIVNGLKFFSRQEKFEFREVDLFECIQEAYKLIKNELIRNKINFENNLEKGKYIISGSKQQLEQIFINLLINSIKAIKSMSGVTGEISIYAKESDKESVRVHVKDNGCGISEVNLNMIFNPFFTTHLDDGGTGLGLSIVYGILKEHKASVEVSSVLNKGTEFIITIPIGMNK